MIFDLNVEPQESDGTYVLVEEPETQLWLDASGSIIFSIDRDDIFASATRSLADLTATLIDDHTTIDGSIVLDSDERAQLERQAAIFAACAAQLNAALARKPRVRVKAITRIAA